MKLPHQIGLALAVLFAANSVIAAPLRVLIASDNADFTASYSTALKAGGAEVITATTADETSLSKADVVILARTKFEASTVAEQTALTAFGERGGGVVAIHAAVAMGPAEWGKSLLGGGWNTNESKKFPSTMMLYVVSNSHPIVKESSPFDVDDETLYDLELSGQIFVTASAFTPNGRDGEQTGDPQIPGRDVRASIYDLQPQMWNYETAKHRAAVFLQGAPTTLAHASMRAFILRAVAWTGKVDDVDQFCSKENLANLRYPVGGPMRAADAIEQFKMQPGFVASVVAEEPLVNKPIALQWDGKGRMWVAETPEYPNGKRPAVAPHWKETSVLEPGNYDRPGRDSISILSDTNADGKMDKKDVFYTGLELVTGFCLAGDGAVAVAQPHIVFLHDADGDGKAELATPLFSGFAPGDTHFVANHFINAPDGWIYASTGSDAEARNPKSNELMAKISPGVFRFKADGSAIQQVASQGGNSFGGEVTSDMEIYHGKATSGNPVQQVVLPEWVLAKAPNTKEQSFASVNPGRTIIRADLPDRAPLMQIDQVGRFTAACATAIYEGGAWPLSYHGKMFITEPILDVIHVEVLLPDGPKMKGELVTKDQEWLRSMDYWFCPIDVCFGPDGAMYVLDFYTPVVTHNDTRGPQHGKSGASIRPDRDQYFGRIYRIQHSEAKTIPVPDLTTSDAADLAAAFTHPNKTVRFNALRILVEKSATLGKQAIPALQTLAVSGTQPSAKILALWALHRLSALDQAIFSSALRSHDAAVRKNAMLIAESGGLPLLGRQVEPGLADEDVRVRLATLRALIASPMSKEANSVLLSSSSKFDDPWSKAAASAAGAGSASLQLEEILANPATGQSEESVRSLASSLASSKNEGHLLGVLLASVTSPNSTVVATILQELGRNPPPPPGDLDAATGALVSLLTSSNQSLASASLPLAVAWNQGGKLDKHITKAAEDTFAVANDTVQSESLRSEAVRTLISARTANHSILTNMIHLLEKPQSDDFTKNLITALTTTGEPQVGTALVKAFSALPMPQQEFAFEALIGRPEWTGLLLDSIESKSIDSKTFSPTRISRFTAHPDAGIAKRASMVFTSGAPPSGKDEMIAKLLPEMEKPANLSNGKQMFAAVCAVCHRLDDAGHVFGPDLGGIGSHPTLELLTHIVNPNLMVDDEHRTWNITMKDGTQFSALIASENEARLQIRQPGGVMAELKTDDVASREKGLNSLMPEGLEAMGAENVRDIIAYIRSCAPKTAPEK